MKTADELIALLAGEQGATEINIKGIIDRFDAVPDYTVEEWADIKSEIIDWLGSEKVSSQQKQQLRQSGYLETLQMATSSTQEPER